MRWNARGLIFENCNCQLICPGHVHFDQLCSHERCTGYWAIRVDEGRFGDVVLDGVAAIIVYDSPQHMIDGGWIQGLIIDEAANAEQAEAIEGILTGRAGGPWAKIAPFVGTALPTRREPIAIDDDGAVKRVAVRGLLDARVESIRGRDRTRPVTFENMFNQIHPPSMVIARGSTTYDDGTIRIVTDGTHALWTQFEWVVNDA